MLLLDSEALSALAHGPPDRRDRVRALVEQMRARERPIATAGVVLPEVVRGHPRDAGVFSALRRERVQVRSVDTRIGVRAGQLLGALRAGSDQVVDACLVAVADLEGGAIVATVDTADLEALAAHAVGVTVADLNA